MVNLIILTKVFAKSAKSDKMVKEKGREIER